MPHISTFAPAAGLLWAIIESYGLDPAALFREEGFELSFPIDPDARIPYETIDRVRARAAELSGDESFGLRAGDCMHPSHLGALGFSWLASRSLRIALQRWARYIRMLNSKARLELNEVGDFLELEFAIDLPSLNKTARDDSGTATLIRMMRFNFGQEFNPASVSLKRPRPADIEPWEDYFRCDIEFGMKRNVVRILVEHADTILSSANPNLAQLHEEMVVQYLLRLDQEDFIGRVRAEIVHQLPCGHFDQALVAGTLHMAPRTMRRKLQLRGTSFQSLLYDIRRDLSIKLIGDSSLSMTQISYMLGFSEVSSFTRAFRKWHGKSPTQARDAAGLSSWTRH